MKWVRIFSKHQKNDSENKLEPMQYDSEVYWFRDYWSNRLKLNRNIQAEDFKIDVEKNFPSKELTVDLALTGKCNVQSRR